MHPWMKEEIQDYVKKLGSDKEESKEKESKGKVLGIKKPG